MKLKRNPQFRVLAELLVLATLPILLFTWKDKTFHSFAPSFLTSQTFSFLSLTFVVLINPRLSAHHRYVGHTVHHHCNNTCDPDSNSGYRKYYNNN
jgi:hypothetical protein